METAPLVPENAAEIASPTLVLHWENVEENLRRMIAMAGSPERLRPHMKTHKLPQIVSRLGELGVRKAKCATIAEAEVAAGAGATDVLLAAHLVGPNIARFIALMRAFPDVIFSGLADDATALEILNAAAVEAGVSVRVMLDLDIGQGRTGVPPGASAAKLYTMIAESSGLIAAGLHAYDGHLHQRDPAERAAACEAAFAPVSSLREALVAAGVPVPCIVAGGTPTFPMHARRPGVECSPGTCVLWDAGYGSELPDLEFLPAAVLLTRVISRPGARRLCLDLGYKAVASEMPQPRVIFPELPKAKVVMHNEEHLVLETDRAAEFPVGTILAGIPWHICPTVALHSFVHMARGNRIVEVWPVTGRTRKISC